MPSPINGEPKNKLLKQLKTKLRANSNIVETDLDDGDHGYLGLLLTNAEYAHTNPTPDPFVAPDLPTALAIGPNLMAVEAVSEKEK